MLPRFKKIPWGNRHMQFTRAFDFEDLSETFFITSQAHFKPYLAYLNLAQFQSKGTLLWNAYFSTRNGQIALKLSHSMLWMIQKRKRDHPRPNFSILWPMRHNGVCDHCTSLLGQIWLNFAPRYFLNNFKSSTDRCNLAKYLLLPWQMAGF